MWMDVTFVKQREEEGTGQHIRRKDHRPQQNTHQPSLYSHLKTPSRKERHSPDHPHNGPLHLTLSIKILCLFLGIGVTSLRFTMPTKCLRAIPPFKVALNSSSSSHFSRLLDALAECCLTNPLTCSLCNDLWSYADVSDPWCATTGGNPFDPFGSQQTLNMPENVHIHGTHATLPGIGPRTLCSANHVWSTSTAQRVLPSNGAIPST